MSSSTGNGAVFLDRDGTVSEEVGYMYDVSLYRVFPWTGAAIRRINQSGLYAVLATNQSGLARGYFGRTMLDRVHRKLARDIGRSGAHLDGIYYCSHLPDAGCDCRKPKPGLLIAASKALNIDLNRSYMVGDRLTDVRAGQAAGARTVLVLSGDGTNQLARRVEGDAGPDHVARTLGDAVDFILNDQMARRRETLMENSQ
jgi:D-glycero-D-manno-heptose 1,7-bisphosphate phosphatase